MDDKKSKILTYVTGLIGLIGFYFFIRIVMVGDDAIETNVDLQASILSPFISFSKYLLIVTALISVVFSLLNLTKHPDVLKTALIGIAVMGVLLAVAYFFASDGAVTDGMGKVIEGGEAGNVSKWVSALINYSFILGTIGLGFFLFDFVKSLVKN
jgi:glucan phosphoethanolaminetransferase (alkaline phosphatase superfamily)